MTHVAPHLSDKWRYLGYVLIREKDNPRSIIDEIATNNQGNVKSCAEKLFTKWLVMMLIGTKSSNL